MSDEMQPDGAAGRHATARQMADRAIAAQAEGEDEEAERLFGEAARIDPDALAAALADHAADPADPATGADADPQDDEEIAAMTRTIQPGSDAQSRAGIGGEDGGAGGSGADEQGG